VVKFEIASEKYKCLWEVSKRHFVFYGGRGGGKDHSIARYILWCMMQYKTRVLVCREVQKSIADSQHRLFVDIIDKHGLSHLFEITDREIRCPSMGSEIVFSGLSRNSQSIKSIEGIDICFVNEAQAISRESLDFLLPTIRKSGSIIIFALNPQYASDPVYADFVAIERDDTHRCLVSIEDNRFVSKDLLEQSATLHRIDPERWNHVYGGECVGEEERSLIRASEVFEARKRIAVRDESLPIIAGLDPSGLGQDRTVLVRVRGMEVLSYHVSSGGRVPDVVEWAKELFITEGFDALVVDASGSTGVYDGLSQWASGMNKSLDVFRFLGGSSPRRPELYNNKRTESWCMARDWLREGGKLPDNDAWNELSMVQYLPDGGERVKLLPKARLPHSPDIGDAWSMALYFRASASKRGDMAKVVPSMHQRANHAHSWAG